MENKFSNFNDKNLSSFRTMEDETEDGAKIIYFDDIRMNKMLGILREEGILYIVPSGNRKPLILDI